MNEEEKNIARETESTQDNENGNQSEGGSLIDKANQAAERLEIATADFKLENDRREEFEAKRMLGGQSQAGKGNNAQTMSEEEIKKMKAAEYFKGTALEKAINEN